MNIFEQIKNQMHSQFMQQESSYLLPSDLNTVLGFCNTQPDVTKLEGCNVIAVFNSGDWVLFGVNTENQKPPNRSCSVYFSHSGKYTTLDVVGVFNMVQQQCIAWTQI